MTRARTSRVRRGGAIAAVLAFVTALGPARVSATATDPPAVPDVACTDTSLAETTQGRVPLADYAGANPRAALGYQCNASAAGHIAEDNGAEGTVTGGSGGFRTYRYADSTHHVCAFYDHTLLFPLDVIQNPGDTGVWVLDMTDPAHPLHTATLVSPAMQSPHESLSLNAKRGLLGAVAANPLFYPGQFDLYDVSTDCTHPALQSSLPTGVLGHEGSFAPDGNTYYAASLFGHTIAGIDTTNPRATRTVWVDTRFTIHGLNVSNDGNTLYFADVVQGNDPSQPGRTRGMTQLDVSQVQARQPVPSVPVAAHLTWPEVSTPQTDLPFTETGHHYLAEIDEYANGSNNEVGAARIIDLDTVSGQPAVVSNIRLAVHNAWNASATDATAENHDPGAQAPSASNNLQGYAGHYCALPSRVDPKYLACSMILSGLRVFDISNLTAPVEIAYFNRPATYLNQSTGQPAGAYAMAQPAFDCADRQVWYADGDTGFWSVSVPGLNCTTASVNDAPNAND